MKDVKNLFRLKKEIDENTIKGIRNFLKLKWENKAIKNRTIRKIRNLFEQERRSL